MGACPHQNLAQCETAVCEEFAVECHRHFIGKAIRNRKTWGNDGRCAHFQQMMRIMGHKCGIEDAIGLYRVDEDQGFSVQTKAWSLEGVMLETSGLCARGQRKMAWSNHVCLDEALHGQ